MGQNAPPGIEPIDDRICILFHGGGENDEGIPAGDGPEEEIDKGALVDVVESGIAAEDDIDHVLAWGGVGGGAPEGREIEEG